MVSNALISAANASETTEVFIVLLKIDHYDLSVPIRLANNTEDVISNGFTYIGFPFEAILFNEDEQTPRAQIRVQNVDRRIGQVIRSLTNAPTLSVSVVLASDPDVIELDWLNTELVNIDGNVIDVTGDIVGPDYTTEPWPSRRATANYLPGLFLR